MTLLTTKLIQRFRQVGSQEYVKDPIVITKFFHPFSHWTWYATEYDEKNKEFFGWVKGDFPEMGYFSLKELESINLNGLPMERDEFWNEIPLSQVMGKENA